jgi:ribosomal protein S17E
MGRVRTKTVKKSAKVIIERYYPKLSLDFETNKRICDEIAIIASKRLRNKIAGYTTHLYVPTPGGCGNNDEGLGPGRLEAACAEVQRAIPLRKRFGTLKENLVTRHR